MLVVGVLLMFVGVAMIATRIVRPLAYVLGAPGARFGGAAGKLARENAVRTPARTASTAAAVMIGLALITFVAVIGQGFKSSFTDAVNTLFIADYSVSAGAQRRTAHEQGRRCRREARPASTAVSADALRRGQGRRQDRLRHRRRREPDEGRSTSTWTNGSNSVPEQLGTTRRVRARPVRRRPLAEDRLAARDRDADRQDHPGSRHRHRRPAQGRLAVRRDLGVQGDLRRVVRKPRQRVHVREHPRRAVRREHRRAREEPRGVPGRRRRDARRVQEQPDAATSTRRCRSCTRCSASR